MTSHDLLILPSGAEQGFSNFRWTSHTSCLFLEGGQGTNKYTFLSTSHTICLLFVEGGAGQRKYNCSVDLSRDSFLLEGVAGTDNQTFYQHLIHTIRAF